MAVDIKSNHVINYKYSYLSLIERLIDHWLVINSRFRFQSDFHFGKTVVDATMLNDALIELRNRNGKAGKPRSLFAKPAF